MVAPLSLPLRVERHHLFVERDGRRELVDTGSPLSLPAAELGPARDRVGVPFDRLLGMDELGLAPFRIDLPGRRLELGTPHVAVDGSFAVTSSAGVPRLAVRTAGRELLALLDTGAPITYLPAEVLPTGPPCGHYEDFLPGFGIPFRTGLYRVELEVGGRRIRTPAGTLPAGIQTTLEAFGAKGILGMPVLRRVALSLDLEGGIGCWGADCPT